MTHRLALTIALAAAGCIGIQTNPHHDKPDAGPDKPDAPEEQPDAPPDLFVSHHYIIDKQIIPTTNTMARTFGLDLNGDAAVDNQLGMVMGVFAGQGFDVQAVADVSVDRGGILMLVDLESNGFVTHNAKLTLFSGANPQPPPCNGGADPICRHHLDGDGSFIVSVSSAHDVLLTGAFDQGTLTTSVGASNRLHLQTSLWTSGVATLELRGARVKISDVSTTNIASGVIAGGVLRSDIDTKLLPGWAADINVVVAKDCGGAPPSCGCGSATTGKTLIGLFDTNHNCSISVAELQNNSLIMALLAPDLTLDGQPALSLGIGFTAVRATFTP